MSYRAYVVMWNVTAVILLGTLMLASGLLLWNGSVVAGIAGVCLSFGAGLGCLVGLGMAFMLPTTVPCPHCAKECAVQVNFFNSRPELSRPVP